MKDISATHPGKQVLKDSMVMAKLTKHYIYDTAWAILGGESFMAEEPVSTLDFLAASINGIPKLAVENLAAILKIPMKDMAALLNLSYKTLARKRKTDVLNNVVSSLSIEIANTISKGLAVFEDADKFNRWLHKENKILKGQKPFNLLNTPTGIKLVSQILGRIDEGVYS
ncbi:MAG: antitoxin Xre/MbcA/ParS toxin-binding domain-containing protein [Chitinophagaceae bacterium]